MFGHKSITIKTFITRVSLLFSALGFLVIYWAASSAYTSAVQDSANQVSKNLAQSISISMQQAIISGKPREQLESYIAALENQDSSYPYSINLYRGDSVTQLYGAVEQPEPSPLINRTFMIGRPHSQRYDNKLRYLYPIKATGECLACHNNAKSGDVLGIIEIYQDMQPLVVDAKRDLLLYLIAIAPFPFLLAMLVVRSMDRKIKHSVNFLKGSIEQVKTVSDLTHMELRSVDSGFKDLNDLFLHMEDLTSKMRTVAVDKDLLEFEIRLLEKFVITSEVVKDWREYICLLLNDINQVITAYNMFSIFKVDDELFDLEIFWLNPPTQQTRNTMEKAVREALNQSAYFCDISLLKINHSVVNTDGPAIDMPMDTIELQTKSLFVDAPKIGGIVGIGVHADIVKDQTRVLVMESILSTLLNVVGSVKAIYKYTRDLEFYATRDPLTELYNQRLFWELLDYEIGRSMRHDYRFSLLLIDFDNFKSINDAHGHAFGDKFLQTFAKTVDAALRGGDMLARYGGDEFVVILPEAGQEQASMISDRVMAAMRTLNLEAPDGSRVKATLSIGIGVCPDHANNGKDLFMFADNMMYKAKSQGKNQSCLPSAEDVVDVFKDISEKNLLVQHAIEHKKLVPCFQPIMQMASGEIGAIEVLSRIDLGDNKLMGAHEFIEIAESMGMIHLLDYIIMEKAFATSNAHNYQGLLFINLSPRSLLVGEFLSTVRQLIKQFDIAPERIVFEITERDTVKNLTLLEQFVRNLKDAGFGLAIDDFGSGFSSFHYLKRFPIDFVKIEGEFIANISQDKRDLAFVRSIASLAHQLGARTVAEFVEDKEVLEHVNALGITYAQGYYISRPVTDLSAAVACSMPLDRLPAHEPEQA